MLAVLFLLYSPVGKLSTVDWYSVGGALRGGGLQSDPVSDKIADIHILISRHLLDAILLLGGHTIFPTEKV